MESQKPVPEIKADKLAVKQRKRVSFGRKEFLILLVIPAIILRLCKLWFFD
jgi:hypothetical protein